MGFVKMRKEPRTISSRIRQNSDAGIRLRTEFSQIPLHRARNFGKFRYTAPREKNRPGRQTPPGAVG
jgi:hypothetical protein